MELNIYQTANVLVIAHTMFSISLLGVGSPFMGHYFQVHVVCHLQGLSLDDDESGRLFFFFIILMYYM